MGGRSYLDVGAAWQPDIDGPRELRLALDERDVIGLKTVAIGLAYAGFTLERARRWLDGQGLELVDKDAVSKAWQLVCFADCEAWQHRPA